MLESSVYKLAATTTDNGECELSNSADAVIRIIATAPELSSMPPVMILLGLCLLLAIDLY